MIIKLNHFGTKTTLKDEDVWLCTALAVPKNMEGSIGGHLKFGSFWGVVIPYVLKQGPKLYDFPTCSNDQVYNIRHWFHDFVSTSQAFSHRIFQCPRCNDITQEFTLFNGQR